MADGILSRFDTFIFDLDGVLLDSMYYWRYSTIEYLESIGYEVSDELRHEAFNRSGGDIFRGIAADSNFDMNKAGMAVADRMKWHYENDIHTKPNVIEALSALHSSNKRVCIATATTKRYFCPSLERFGLSALIDEIYDSSTVGFSKSEVCFYTKLLDLLNINSNQCVFFDDSLTNIQNAKQAGIFTCGVEDKIQLIRREEIINTADIFISDFKDLLKLI